MNREYFGFPSGQKKGLCTPTLRFCVITSQETGSIVDAEIGPYLGKGTGENMLAQKMLDNFQPGDIVVVDKFYDSYWFIALCVLRGVEVVVRKRGRRSWMPKLSGLEDGSRIIQLDRPKFAQRPEWLSEELYHTIPEKLELREVVSNFKPPRDKNEKQEENFTVFTTLVDDELYSSEEVCWLYKCRWNCELDLRSLKSKLNLSELRCKSPAMVEKEFYVTILGYNLVCDAMTAAGELCDVPMRCLSFTRSCSHLLVDIASHLLRTLNRLSWESNLRCLGRLKVLQRPDRIEPREIKRRGNRTKYLTKPREERRAELMKNWE